MPGSLKLVATPIGNLGDMSPRALEALQAADLILCEDTRMTAKLLHLHGLKAPLQRCDDHQESRVIAQVIDRLHAGQTLALVSDAGTPLISDPGFALVRAVRAAGLTVTAVPGPAAPILALILSGLPSDRFLFGGFLPSKSKARKEIFQEFKSLRATLIFFENPKRLAACLADAQAIFGPERATATARELTKKFEEVRTGSLAELQHAYTQEPTPKGEMVLLFGPATKTPAVVDVDALLQEALKTQSASAAAKEIAQLAGQPKSQIYARALALKDAPPPPSQIDEP